MALRCAIFALCSIMLGSAVANAQKPPTTANLDALYGAGKHREVLALVDAMIKGDELLTASDWLRTKVEAGAPYPYAERIGHMLRSHFPHAPPLQQTAAAYLAYAGIIALRESIVCADREAGERIVGEIEARGAEILAIVRAMPVEGRGNAAQTAIKFEIQNGSKRNRGEMLCDARVPEAYWRPLELAARRAILIVPQRFMQIEFE
jgi:hypothetical protein